MVSKDAHVSNNIKKQSEIITIEVLVTFGRDFKWDKVHEGFQGGLQNLIS